MSKRYLLDEVKKDWDSIFSDSSITVPNNKSSNDRYKNVNYYISTDPTFIIKQGTNRH